MLLVDIGNSYAHIYSNGTIEHIKHSEFFKEYSNYKLYYINVNPKLYSKLILKDNWIDISSYIKIDGEYSDMGVDRRALMLGGDDGIYIDAGSAITIDKKINNRFIGGMILPGLKYIKESYGNISSKLNIDKFTIIDLDNLPNSSTKESVNFGAIAPVLAVIKSINRESLPLYFSGGDGKILADMLDAKYDETLIFKGMKRVIKERLC